MHFWQKALGVNGLDQYTNLLLNSLERKETLNHIRQQFKSNGTEQDNNKAINHKT